MSGLSEIEQQLILPTLSSAVLAALNKDDVLAMLGDVLGPLGPHRIASVAASSYLHTNGFYKIVLHRDRETERALRLHVWPHHTFDSVNIHDHKWYFVSRILAGSLIEERYNLGPGSEWQVYHYNRQSTNGESAAERLISVGPAGADYIQTIDHRTGETYDMPLGILHRTRSGPAGAITMVITDRPTQKLAPSVVVVPGASTPWDVAPRRLTVDELTEVIATARRSISDA